LSFIFNDFGSFYKTISEWHALLGLLQMANVVWRKTRKKRNKWAWVASYYNI